MKNQLNILVELALRDGEMDLREKEMILRLGESYGLSEEEINDIILFPQDGVDLTSLTNDEKFECLYNIIHLMKVDGKIFDEEIDYCMKVAGRLGYPMEAVMEMYQNIHANVKIAGAKEKLKHKFNAYLKDKE